MGRIVSREMCNISSCRRFTEPTSIWKWHESGLARQCRRIVGNSKYVESHTYVKINNNTERGASSEERKIGKCFRKSWVKVQVVLRMVFARLDSCREQWDVYTYIILCSWLGSHYHHLIHSNAHTFRRRRSPLSQMLVGTMVHVVDAERICAAQRWEKMRASQHKCQDHNPQIHKMTEAKNNRMRAPRNETTKHLEDSS